MKALEKDRRRRYETANAFAQDIARFLADEPVAAGPPSASYRMRKFVLRNRRGLLSGTAAAVALLAGLAVAGGIWLDSTFEKNQRIARAIDLIGQAERCLEQSAATDFDDDRHFREARELDRRVDESLAGIRYPDDSPRERRERLSRAVATEERARKLVAGIEEVMMRDKASLQASKSRAQLKIQALAAAFADFGITPLDGPVADTVELMKAGRKTLQDRMLAGLTTWSHALEKTNPEQSARLEEIIDRSDADPWRLELRQAIKAGDAAALAALAERREITEQPTMTVLQLSSVLEDKQLAGAVAKLLRRAQREAPESFWSNYILGETLAGAIDREEGDDTRVRAFHTRGANFGSAHPGLIPKKLPVRPEFDEAIGFLRAAVAARPDAEAAWMVLGISLTVSGHLDEAIVTYQNAVSRFPEAGDLPALLGQALLYQHRPEDALPYLRRAAERDPANERTQFELGQVLLEMSEYEEARAALLKAKLVSEDARGAGETSELKESRKLTLLGIEITNSAEAAHLWVALAQNLRGASEESLASTELALNVNPNSAVAHYLRSLVLMNKGELAAAKISIQKALELQPEMATAHNILGSIMMLRGDWSGAVASFRRTIELDPKDETAHCNLGGCLGALGKFQEAHSSLETALKLAPEIPLGWINLGAVFEMQDKPEQALESFRKAVALDPSDMKARSGIARLLWKAGKHEESIAAHRQLNDAEAYWRLSASLIKEERIEDAIDFLEQAVALKPDFSAAHHDLGAMYIKTDRHRDAIAPLRTAIQLAPNMASAHHQLGFVLLFQNDYEAAVDSCLKAVELAPEVEQFKTTLLSALLSSGRIKAAELVHGACDSPDCIIAAMVEKDRQLRKILAKEGPGAPGIPVLLGDQSKDFFRMAFSSIIRRPHSAEDLRAVSDERREEVAKCLASLTVRLIQIRKMGDEDHPEANEEDSRALAEGILQKLADGDDFSELAEEHSQGWAGGKPETVAFGDLSTDLNAAAFSLKDGDFTRKLIEDKAAFYLLKVESRQAGKDAGFEDSKVQEIIKGMLTQQRRTAWEQRYLARVQEPAPDPATERARSLAD
jgi:tetratricopeptide (TPR) repeat protein